MRDGTLYGIGYNSKGQIGIGTMEYSSQRISTPVRIRGELKNEIIIDISCGSYFSMALTKSGKLYAWGDNYNRQLCVDSTDSTCIVPRLVIGIPSNIIQISCGMSHSMALTGDGRVFFWGLLDANPITFTDIIITSSIMSPMEIFFHNSKIKMVSSGTYCSLALSEEGKVYSFGQNGSGSLGI